MDSNKIRLLIDRAIRLYPQSIPLSELQIKNMEKRLGVIFPDDFKKISEQFPFDSLGTNFHAFYDDETNEYGVIPETLRLRRDIGFPHDSVFLSEDDVSVIILKTQKTSSEPSPVVWIDVTDIERYCEGKSLEAPYQIFPSFTDFFEYLVTEEENEREEERKGAL